ncbi:DUF4276 family protein [Gloeobacter morelensis]|uniref:DUF4276 family protein n=1 Tax=Gloeobacter morelensis MG652769 TaxID=2781736 RepID=A0ABY3PMY7_9CYAN|nr:DUF4276 family protein [Gloeobacter morelensis]UFP94934.1 DUF4276 family protein [Gloeobacter morelensis MG652769]
MTLEIKIFVEGGSTGNMQELRQGFDALLDSQKQAARKHRVLWRLAMRGSRQQTYEAFIHATAHHANQIIVLLVDAEERITYQGNKAHVTHLEQRDKWKLSAVCPDRVHLMVQTMETWLVADIDALRRYYGQGFNSSALPQRQNLEEEPKQAIYAALTRATQQTQKGEYAKIKHASQLLGKIRPDRIAARCPRFALLTQWLDKTIAQASNL